MSTGASASRRGLASRLASRLAAAGAICLLAVAGGALGAVATGAGTALASGPTIVGGGSSYAAVAIDNWVGQVSQLYGDNVDYGVSSAVEGLDEFALNQLNFGASEIGYSTGQASSTPTEPYQYLPDVAGATCLDYNLTGKLGGRVTSLRLDARVLAEIFTGLVTKWDSPAIAALNPSLKEELPDSPIVVVWREDPSGENYLFSQYLDYLEGSIWRPFIRQMQQPAAVQALWPQPTGTTSDGPYDMSNWVGQNGSDGASDFVASQNGSITYVETAYAILHHDPCAAIENASGHFVQPSEYDDSVGLEKALLLPDLEQKLDGVYTNPNPSAYPISAYSYLITPKGPGSMNPAKGAVLGQFIRFFACTGQQSAGVLGYAPLPPNLVDEDFEAIDRIPGAAKAPARATAANCKNPYVDGQTPLPGESTILGQKAPPSGSVTSTPVTTTTTTTAASTASSSTTTTTAVAATTTTTTQPTSTPGASAPSSGRSAASSASRSRPRESGRPRASPSGSRRRRRSPAAPALANGQYPGQAILPGSKPGRRLPDGQYVGDALAAESASVLGARLPAVPIALSIAALVALLSAPPLVVALGRRRRRRADARGSP